MRPLCQSQIPAVTIVSQQPGHGWPPLGFVLDGLISSGITMLTGSDPRNLATWLKSRILRCPIMQVTLLILV